MPGFDYGNSPSQIENVDFFEKIAIHTTSCGTQGIVKSINAKQIITGSLVNAKAIVRYIIKNKIEEISLLTLCREGKKPFDEGYEAGYTKEILDVLKENDVKATFFLTAHYVNTQEELVKQMIDEGHIIGEHTPISLMSGSIV